MVFVLLCENTIGITYTADKLFRIYSNRPANCFNPKTQIYIEINYIQKGLSEDSPFLFLIQYYFNRIANDKP
jgi:hypothetical protein